MSSRNAKEEKMIVVYGANWCPDCKRAKKFLGQQQIQYRWVDIEKEPKAVRFVEEVNQGKRIIPTIVFPDESILVEPSNAELARKLGLKVEAEREFYDLIVVGGGPAGLTAAIYAAREGIDALVIERSAWGGQAGITERLDNYPGFPEGISGQLWAARVVEQAERFGVELLQAQEVQQIGQDGNYRWVRTDAGELRTKALLIATGADYRRLGVPGEEDFIGVNVHFCATCDGAFYKGKRVAVVGGGNSAAEGACTLLNFAQETTLLVREGELRAQKTLRDKINTLQEKGRLQVLYHTVVKEFRGNRQLEAVVIEEKGVQRELKPDGVFIFIGLSPVSQLVKGLVETDENGFVVTQPNLETSLPGVFAAGDVRATSTKQVTSAAGEGATATLMIREYLKTV